MFSPGGGRVNPKKIQRKKEQKEFAQAAHFRECLTQPKDPAACTWPTNDLPKRPPGANSGVSE